MKNLILILFLCTSTITFGQGIPQSCSVKGIVIDSTSKQPVDIVTVNLKNTANQVVGVIATKPDGVFNFDRLTSGKYMLTLISFGYTSKIIPVDLTTAANPDINLGNISLSQQGIQLAAVSVTADKPIVKQEIDKLTYDLQADPESKSNSVLDMMRKVQTHLCVFVSLLLVLFSLLFIQPIPSTSQGQK